VSHRPRRERPRQHGSDRPDALRVADLLHRLRFDPLAPGTAGWMQGPRHADETWRDGEPGSADPPAWHDDVLALDELDVFAAANIIRRRAHDSISEVYNCRARLRRVRKWLDATGDRAHLVSGITEHVLAVEFAETRLVDALDALESATVRAHAAYSAIARLYPHGGTSIAFPATHRALADRRALAENLADGSRLLARRAVRMLVYETVRAECFASTVHRHVDQVLDAAVTAAAGDSAPPTVLRVLRRALPPDQRDDWWGEVCALFAEATREERRAARLSFLDTAPLILWTSWVSTRRDRAAAVERSRDRTGSDPVTR
jgi:hypothetical protein